MMHGAWCMVHRECRIMKSGIKIKPERFFDSHHKKASYMPVRWK